MGRDALPLVIENALAIVTEFGKEEERGRYSHRFGLVVIDFKFVYCHAGFDVILAIYFSTEKRRSRI